jgi:SAM-dependent methyltransferase
MAEATPPGHDAYRRTRFTALPARDRAWRPICRYLQRYVPPDGAVLDLGAGYCSFINNITAGEKHALDAFEGVAAHAAPDVTAHVGSCSDLARFADDLFDIVFASNLLEHLDRAEIAATLSEIRRVLRTDGRLILLQPNFRYCASEYFDDYTHRSVFSHVSLADLLAASGFAVVRVHPRFLPLSFKSRVPAWPWLVSLYLRLPVRPLGKQMLLVASPDGSDPLSGSRNV